MSDPRATPTPAGRRRFYLKQRIGQGAFGEVFLAEQDSGAGFRRPVAIKLLNENVAGSRDAARRMRDEARILGRLNHRNIVSVLDLVRVDQRWAVIMDYVPGADLEQVLHALELTNGIFPGPAAFEVGAAVCRALHAAFNTDDGQGARLEVVHRDIKPSNIRVTTDGEIKVLDFGVARVNLETRESATRAGGWIGTERYMAPERILMEGDTLAGDVYATAASVVELLLGRPLGKTPVLEERHVPFLNEALAEVRPKLYGPPEIVEQAMDQLAKALSNRPEVRPSAEDLARSFGAVARRLDGDSLGAFCAEFIPKVAGVLGYTAVPVSGVLTESSDGATSGRGAVGTPSPMTIIPEGNDSSRTLSVSELISDEANDNATGIGLTPPPSPRSVTSAPPETQGPPRLWLFLGAGLILALGVTAITATAVVMMNNRPGSLPEPVPIAVPVTSTIEIEPPAPAPVPVPVPDVAPEPVAAPAPVIPAPTPRPKPKPAPVPVAPAPVPVVAPDAPRVTAALIVLTNATALQVTCGDKENLGTASVRISDFPAGTCSIRASWLGKWLDTTVRIDKPREVRCSVTGDTLTCS